VFSLRARRGSVSGRPRGAYNAPMTIGEDLQVRRDDKGRRGAFYIEQDGRRIAEQTFSVGPDGKVAVIDHTAVDASLRGQGIARKLTLATVEWARKSGVKLVPVCPFAKKVIESDASLHDVLA
jgi:uncharacterized protein